MPAAKKTTTTRKPKAFPPGASEEHLQRVRRICFALPETAEKVSHGEPTFFVRKKVFVMSANNHHNDGHIAVWLPAAPGTQERLIEAWPNTYFHPPYVGVRGWVAVELDAISDEDLAAHILEAWRLVAPKRLAESAGVLANNSRR